MGLYDYIISDYLINFEPSFKGESSILNDVQQKFCDDIVREIPQLIEYDPNNHIHDRVRLYYCKSDSLYGISVGITSVDSSSYYNIFTIEDKPISEWRTLNENGFTVLNDMSYNKPMNLLPIVKNWLINYERKIKIKSLLNRIA